MEGGKARWVVVLEVGSGIDHWSLHRALQILGDVDALALHCPDRYAVQMEVTAGGQAEALFVALARCRSALAAARQRRPEFVRVEVLSREEFERDCRRAYGDAAMPQVQVEVAGRPLQLLPTVPTRRGRSQRRRA